jgi:phage baseplate assembly protein V
MSKQTMIRRARMRAQSDGTVQKVRIDVFDTLGRDGIERMQDYGIASRPSEGEGLVLEVAGHLVVLRMDQSSKRPKLALDEVSVWHREGHSVTLKAGKKIVVDCDDYEVNTKNYTVNASTSAAFNTPQVVASAVLASQTINVAGTGMIDGVSVGTHDHGNVQHGNDRTDGPNKSV